LHRQEIGQQRAIEQIDGNAARADVTAAELVIAREQVRRSDVAARPAFVGHELADRGGIAQPEIEALCSDRRNDMRRLADQRHTVRREALCRRDGEWKYAAARLDD